MVLELGRIGTVGAAVRSLADTAGTPAVIPVW